MFLGFRVFRGFRVKSVENFLVYVFPGRALWGFWGSGLFV